MRKRTPISDASPAVTPMTARGCAAPAAPAPACGALRSTKKLAPHAANVTGCGGNVWCGGSLSGILEQLDYVQGMGFDCVRARRLQPDPI